MTRLSTRLYTNARAVSALVERGPVLRELLEGLANDLLHAARAADALERRVEAPVVADRRTKQAKRRRAWRWWRT